MLVQCGINASKGSIKCYTVYNFLPFDGGRIYRTWRYAYTYTLSHTIHISSACRCAVFNLSLIVVVYYCCYLQTSLLRCNWMIYALHDPKRSIAQNEEEDNEKWQVHENFRIQCCSHALRKTLMQDDMHLHSTCTTGYLHSFLSKPTAMGLMWYWNNSNYHCSVDTIRMGILIVTFRLVCPYHLMWWLPHQLGNLKCPMGKQQHSSLVSLCVCLCLMAVRRHPR